MRTTLALDDELVAKAQAFTGLKEKSSLVREALKALIERESARRLARLGGSEPDIEFPAQAAAGARLILVDTSIWIDHLRADNAALKRLLDAGRVLMHPFVLGELALGRMRQREMILAALSDLPPAELATDAEVLGFVDRQALFGRGIGLCRCPLACLRAANGGR